MTKINALTFSRAGDAYLGRPYSEMDCQAFVERCMADCGCRKDLPGSNAWYRECVNSGWAGTPEECVKAFGLVPAGALLFILEQDGKEPAKYRGDGLGNASHIGIKTGRGKGAIHSSASRGCVAESEFHDITIRNGGWNRVGLLDCFEYETINAAIAVTQIKDLDSCSMGSISRAEARMLPQQLTPAGGNEVKKMTATVHAPGGTTVNLRKKPGKGAALVDRVPDGAEVELQESGETWSRVRYKGWTGWMMTEFLEEVGEDAPDSGRTYSVIISGLDLVQARALQANYPGRSEIVKGSVEG